jgi:hypothetical protein
MTDGGYGPVAVSRRIASPAADIFRILADPRRHTDLDGSEMLRGAVSDAVVRAVGDIFVMRMYHPPLGDYEMVNHVVEYELDRRIGWEPEAVRGHPGIAPRTRWGHRWSYELTADGPDATIVTEIYDCSRAPHDEQVSMDGGRVWADSMAETLERLDLLCAADRGSGGGSEVPDGVAVVPGQAEYDGEQYEVDDAQHESGDGDALSPAATVGAGPPDAAEDDRQRAQHGLRDEDPDDSQHQRGDAEATGAGRHGR